MLKVCRKYEKDPRIPTFDQSIKVVDGVKQVVFKERVEDPFKGVSYSDFSLQSLIDADAVDLLQPVGTISRDQLSIADFAEYCANNIGYTVDNVKTNIEFEKEIKNNVEEK